MASLSTGLTIDTQVHLEMAIDSIRRTIFYPNVRDYKTYGPICSKELSPPSRSRSVQASTHNSPATIWKLQLNEYSNPIVV